MWILFDGGFVSIVAHREWSDAMCVRARSRRDLEAFCGIDPFALAEIRETPDADYRFRAVLRRTFVVMRLDQIATAVDYDNFKTRVYHRHGAWREKLYHGVWALLMQLQGRPND